MTRMADSFVMVKMDGKTFQCECGCNVFTRMSSGAIYRCNACRAEYETVKEVGPIQKKFGSGPGRGIDHWNKYGG